MFGNELPDEVFESVVTALPQIDREKLEEMSLNAIRLELDPVFDEAEQALSEAVMHKTVVDTEVDRYSEIKDAYSLVMREIEAALSNNVAIF